MDGMIGIGREPMLDMFIFETNQLLEQLEEILLLAEKTGSIKKESVNEIFRIMHTIKGSSAMMMFQNIASLAHAVEDMFFVIREGKAKKVNSSTICDLVLEASDFIKEQMCLIETGEMAKGECPELTKKIKSHTDLLKGITSEDESVEEAPVKPKQYYISRYDGLLSIPSTKYTAVVHFSKDSGMENIRAYSLVFSLQEKCKELYYTPQDIISNPETADIIVRDGFKLFVHTEISEEELSNLLSQALFVDRFEVAIVEDFPSDIISLSAEVVESKASTRKPMILLGEDTSMLGEEEIPEAGKNIEEIPRTAQGKSQSAKSGMISVNIMKLDKLMDLVGEIVITESMVTRCPELIDLKLDVFHKSANQLRKLTDELQDMVMSIRMLPIAGVFQKMHRLVRDMNKSLKKDVELVLLGEETEVDKNLIDQLSDPLMHLVRNAMDHGMCTTAEREAAGKTDRARITLEARNEGGEIWVQVRDNGKGLNKDKILKKAHEHGLTTKTEAELTEKEIFNFIMLPGFSTKENVSEFSGRGVGMDVVRENISLIGGNIAVDSVWGQGTSITLRIPLTLAIIDGMLVSVGVARYIIPTTSIRESFRAKAKQAIADSDGNELMMIRGECLPVVRLHRRFGVETQVTEFEHGIVMVIDHNGVKLCLFADELLGEQQVVVKPLPAYFKQVKGISGCTIMGDGGISLILNIQELMA